MTVLDNYNIVKMRFQLQEMQRLMHISNRKNYPHDPVWQNELASHLRELVSLYAKICSDEQFYQLIKFMDNTLTLESTTIKE